MRTRTMVIVTTLLDPNEHSKEDLADLYRARWNNEIYQDRERIVNTIRAKDKAAVISLWWSPSQSFLFAGPLLVDNFRRSAKCKSSAWYSCVISARQ